jgi:hypothetical protein
MLSHTLFACVAKECCPPGWVRQFVGPVHRRLQILREVTMDDPSKAPRDRREAANLSDLVNASLTMIAIKRHPVLNTVRKEAI